MRTFNNRRLHLQLYQMFPMLLIIALIMLIHMILLHKYLPSAFDSLMPGHHFLRGDDLRSFGKLNDVISFRDDPFRVVVSGFLRDDFDLLLLQRLIRGLLPRQRLDSL